MLGFKTYLYNIFRDLKFHWLYDASVIQRLVWKWLRRDRNKERWVSCLPDHSLAVAGHRTHRSSLLGRQSIGQLSVAILINLQLQFNGVLLLSRVAWRQIKAWKSVCLSDIAEKNSVDCFWFNPSLTSLQNFSPLPPLQLQYFPQPLEAAV